MLDSFLDHIAREWDVITQAPFIFVAAVLAIGSLVYAGAHWRFSTVEKHLKERLTLRDDQITDYKTKLSGATPDEAKSRMDALESSISELKLRIAGRSLSQAQANIISQIIAGHELRVRISIDMGAPETKKIHGELTKLFENAGWTVIPATVMGISPEAKGGIIFYVSKAGALTMAETLAYNALRAAGFEFDAIEARHKTHPDAEFILTSVPQI